MLFWSSPRRRDPGKVGLRGAGLLVGLVLSFAVAGCAVRWPQRAPSRPSVQIMPPYAWQGASIRVMLRGGGGFEFLAPMRVFFGSTEARVLDRSSDRTELRVIAPAMPVGKVDVRIVVGIGSRYERQMTLREGFSYLPYPQISGVSPTYAKAEGGSRVTLHGSGFLEGAEILVDGKPAPEVRVVASDRIDVLLPAHAAGPASLTLVQFAGTPLEWRTMTSGLRFLAAQPKQTLVLAIRLASIPTGEVLDARLLSASMDRESLEGVSTERALERLVGLMADDLPTRLLTPEEDRVWLLPIDGAAWIGSQAAHMNELPAVGTAIAAALQARGISVVGAEETAPRLDDATLADLAFGTLPVQGDDENAIPALDGATKLLTYRIAAFGEYDERVRILDPTATLAPEQREIAEARHMFDRFESLARTLPDEAASMSMLVVRMPDRPEETRSWTREDLLIEDGLIAGLTTRAPVFEKINGPPVKPPWMYAQMDGLPDPLAYTSWAEFRRANRQVESVFLYRPDGAGLIARLVDAAGGAILWSGRVAPADEILAGSDAESIHDQVQAVLSREDWRARFGPRRRIAVIARPAGLVSRDVWQRVGPIAQEGLLSSLVAAGVTVIEPMLAVYRRPDPPSDRRVLAGSDDLFDPWRELRSAGVTHILEYDLHPPTAASREWWWAFRILDSATGLPVDAWVVEAAEKGDVRRETP